MIDTLQLIGSKEMGGAERWFVRFLQAMQRAGQPLAAGVRRNSVLEQELRGQCALHPLSMRTVWDPWSARGVRGLLKQLRPQLVQTYMGRATRLTRIRPGKGPVHLSRLGGYYKLDGYRHAHAWVVNTEGLRAYLVDAGFPAERVFTIYNFAEAPRPRPADAQLQALREDYGLDPQCWWLLTPGRFVPVKGHGYLLQALADLPERIAGRQVRLLLLGDGPRQQSLRQQAERLGIAERICWAGWQLDPAPFYHLADLVVFPSLEQETFGNVLLEGWSYRRPLVASAFRGARELTRHGRDVWQVPCADAQALARGIEQVLRQPDLAEQLVSAGADRLQADFSEQVIVARYLEVYRQLLGERA